MLIQSILIATLASQVLSTTEWFGDLRAHLNPPRAPAFYDVTYDDNDCPEGLQSNAIPDYVYFGEMIATMAVKEHTECLEQCVSNPKCHAVNFFEPMNKKEKGFCELLSETQLDNPRLMRPFKKAVYYEHIHCRSDEVENASVIKKTSKSTEGEKGAQIIPMNSRVPDGKPIWIQPN
ncbi:hypothetical protein FO519_000380 [Halicephalobus sp. NKZ332]|nr:hypothetical protein FO519_000380 [Halicephalobus sp. NKZ332]